MWKYIIAFLIILLIPQPVECVNADFQEIRQELAPYEVSLFDPWAYDADESGYIEINEVHLALGDYYVEEITIDGLMEVLEFYLQRTPAVVSNSEVIIACQESFLTTDVFYFDDSEYKTVRLSILKEVVADDSVNTFEYGEWFDCDDYTWALMGAFHHDLRTASMPIFVATVKHGTTIHRLITFYLNGEMYLLEPQMDRIFEVPENWELRLLIG